MNTKSTGWKFETCDGNAGFRFKASGGKKAIAALNQIMNDTEARMKEDVQND